MTASLNTTSAELPHVHWMGYPKIGLNGTLSLLRRRRHANALHERSSGCGETRMMPFAGETERASYWL